MVYQAIEAGPFYGLFGLHFNEYTKWTQEEVVAQLDKAEEILNLTPGKRCFVFNGLAPNDEEVDIVDGRCVALCEILKARGYFIIVISDGNYLPLHATKCDHLTAMVRDVKWINYPCNSVVCLMQHGEPTFQPHTDRIPKFALLKGIPSTTSIFKWLRESRYQWTVQGSMNIGGINVE